jgi:hypothetical protein
MVPDVERCGECGFAYDVSAAAWAAGEIRAGAAELAAILAEGTADLAARREPACWSPLEYACHVRDMLVVQRERLLAARRLDRPVAEPMGQDERAELDGYAGQDPADVARQLGDAALLLAGDMARLGDPDWDRTLFYTYPERAERALRWLAVHTVHEVRHHLADVRRQLPARPALTPGEREARWQLEVLVAVDAAGEQQARAVLAGALDALDEDLAVRGDPVIRPPQPACRPDLGRQAAARPDRPARDRPRRRADPLPVRDKPVPRRRHLGRAPGHQARSPIRPAARHLAPPARPRRHAAAPGRPRLHGLLHGRRSQPAS